jgi:hypothetical protein
MIKELPAGSTPSHYRIVSKIGAVFTSYALPKSEPIEIIALRAIAIMSQYARV